MSASGVDKPRFSLVVPIHNEAANIDRLLDEVDEVLSSRGPFQALLVDDASTDDSLVCMRRWREGAKAMWLEIVSLGRRGGQSRAVMAGVERARADIICMMDGDLQNDPHDLCKMLDLVQGSDIAGVQGVRIGRQDNLVRRLSSRIGNSVRNLITGDVVQDSACGIKVFRRDVLLKIPRFAGTHRFVPTLVRSVGGRVLEIPVHHRPRNAGRPKYGIANRAFRGLRDCLAVRRYRRQRKNKETVEVES